LNDEIVVYLRYNILLVFQTSKRQPGLPGCHCGFDGDGCAGLETPLSFRGIGFYLVVLAAGGRQPANWMERR
jgi:hypothetical protein